MNEWKYRLGSDKSQINRVDQHNQGLKIHVPSEWGLGMRKGAGVNTKQQVPGPTLILRSFIDATKKGQENTHRVEITTNTTHTQGPKLTIKIIYFLFAIKLRSVTFLLKINNISY